MVHSHYADVDAESPLMCRPITTADSSTQLSVSGHVRWPVREMHRCTDASDARFNVIIIDSVLVFPSTSVKKSPPVKPISTDVATFLCWRLLSATVGHQQRNQHIVKYMNSRFHTRWDPHLMLWPTSRPMCRLMLSQRTSRLTPQLTRGLMQMLIRQLMSPGVSRLISRLRRAFNFNVRLMWIHKNVLLCLKLLFLTRIKLSYSATMTNYINEIDDWVLT